MSFFDTIKRNAKMITGAVVFLSTVVGAAFTVDARYAKASDVQSLEQQQANFASTIKREQNTAIDKLRKQQIEDKLFELRLNPRPTQADKALIRRYEDQLHEVTQRLNTETR